MNPHYWYDRTGYRVRVWYSRRARGWQASVWNSEPPPSWSRVPDAGRFILGVYPTQEAAVAAADEAENIRNTVRLCSWDDVRAVRTALAAVRAVEASK